MTEKKRTRRSISVRGLTYQRLDDFCKAQGRSVSGYLEEILAEKMDAAGVPAPTVLKAKPKRDPNPTEEVVAANFTF